MYISIDLLTINIFIFQMEVERSRWHISIYNLVYDSFNWQNYLSDITNEVSTISMVKGLMKFHSVFVKLECV